MNQTLVRPGVQVKVRTRAEVCCDRLIPPHVGHLSVKVLNPHQILGPCSGFSASRTTRISRSSIGSWSDVWCSASTGLGLKGARESRPGLFAPLKTSEQFVGPVSPELLDLSAWTRKEPRLGAVDRFSNLEFRICGHLGIFAECSLLGESGRLVAHWVRCVFRQ